MKDLLRDTAIVLICFLPLSVAAFSAEANEINDNIPQVKAAVINCKGDIDYGLYQSIRRRTQIALNEGASYLLFKISTYGGLLESADDISKYLILDIPRLSEDAHTVAYVDTEAISAGAMISVSCRDIIMRTNTTIGDCAPISLGGSLEGVEREKIESFTRAIFARAAKANNYPEPLLKAMVTVQTEVFRVKNLQTGEDEYFESEYLPKDSEKYDLENTELIVKDDELLTVEASKALEYGIARAVVSDINEALDFLAQRDGVKFSAEPILLETTWSEEVARWLNSPAVMAVLVLLAMLGVYLELSTPGLGLPGLVAVISFAIIIGSKYIGGLANWLEVAMFITGIILLLVEFFVIPGFGIAGIAGIVLIFTGLFGMLIKNPPDIVPWPQTENMWNDFTWGVVGLAVGAGGFVVFAWLLSKYLPKIPFLSGLILVPATATQNKTTRISMKAPAQTKARGINVGDIGEVISTLRPTGKVKFGDAIVDVVAKGDFIDRGTKVEIAEIHGNRVVVKTLKEQ